MSAVICDPYHISSLAAYASQHLPLNLTAEAIGAMLYAENVRSVNETAPTEGFQFDESARFEFEIYSGWEIFKSAHCLASQSCLHAGWETSEAKAILAAIMSEAGRDVPGISEPQWQLTPPSRD